MKLGRIEVCYIQSYEAKEKRAYKEAQKELAKLTLKEINGIVTGATFIILANFNMLHAKLNVQDFTNRVETKGDEILDLIQIMGYWAAIIFAAIDIVKAFKKQDIAGLIAIACKYAVAVGILYGLPDIFDVFRDLFQ